MPDTPPTEPVQGAQRPLTAEPTPNPPNPDWDALEPEDADLTRLGIDPEPEEPEDNLDALRREMLAIPEVRDYHNKLKYKRAQDFMVLALHYARKWSLCEDPFRGEALLLDAAIWLRDANRRLDRDLAVQQKPKNSWESHTR